VIDTEIERVAEGVSVELIVLVLVRVEELEEVAL
jgi:hypothetical protein